MFYFAYFIFASFLSQIESLFTSIANSPYIDMIKMFIGCTAWIGSLVLYVRWHEKKKQKAQTIA